MTMHIMIVKDGSITDVTEKVITTLQSLPSDWEDYVCNDEAVAFILQLGVDLGQDGWDNKLAEHFAEKQRAKERRQQYEREAAARRARREERRARHMEELPKIVEMLVAFDKNYLAPDSKETRS